jgi:uncharacterized small protein (DUF1192 family)
VSDVEPRNNLSWRITVLEREVERLKAGQPDVVAERVGMLSLRIGELKAEVNEDMTSLRGEMRERDEARERQIRAFQRIFITVFTGVGVAVTGAVVAIILTGGTP